MIAPAALQARISTLALTSAEFDRAMVFAADRGWLTISGAFLTLTREGFIVSLK